VTTVFPVAGYIGDVPVILAKPQTFMNLSGESVSIMFGESSDVMMEWDRSVGKNCFPHNLILYINIGECGNYYSNFLDL
jgi:hypothetical protein